ncbi:hypothetical protein J7E82_09605 [Arthrobacter sp. ISL-30]|nr:hypothetical protein [Arthrobacter sp. ISL-30]
MGDVLLVGFPALVLLAVLWAVSAALKPRDHGLSDAERYQRELAARSAAHQAAQTQAALAARAKMEASTRHRDAEQRHQQNPQAHSVSGQLAAFAPGGTPSGHQGNILPNGQLNPQLALQLRAMVRSGQKVQAVKLLRQATHVDLSTAKNYIDRL